MNLSKDGMGAREEGPGSPLLKKGVLVWMTIQNSVHTIIVRYSRARPVPHMFLPSCAVFWTEIVKLFVCLLAVTKENNGFTGMTKQVIQTILFHPIDTAKVCVPALVYTLQNNLFYIAASHLDAATFMITSQLKIFTTAMFSVIILRKTLSGKQWFALAMLFLGVSIVQTQSSFTSGISRQNATFTRTEHVAIGRKVQRAFMVPVTDGSHSEPDKVVRAMYPTFGFFCIVLACLASGFAGIYFEKILKGAVEVSVWMRNVQMAMFSIPMSYAGIWVSDGDFIKKEGILYGFDSVVWFTVVWYGIGGLTVAACIKYADNILKNFSTSIAIIISTVASMYIFDFHPNFLFTLGAALVISSIFLYSASAQSSNVIDKGSLLRRKG